MRNTFIDELTLLAEVRQNIVLIVGDLGYSVVEPFAKKFPDRFINAGVAEQNMAGLAAGMASEGYHVFIYSIANFPTFRCAEQIRNDIDYHDLAVTIVSVGGGLSYGPLGYSHHAIQDYALMRCMPNILIAAPGDPMEVRACLRYLVSNPQPSYLRIGKSGEPSFHLEVPNLVPGEWMLISGNPVNDTGAILCTGATLELGMNMQSTRPEYAGLSVYTMPLWGMKYKFRQLEQAFRMSRVITLEDHLIDGGFGSWMLESLPFESGMRNKIDIKALDPRVCGSVASQVELNKLGGLYYDMPFDNQSKN
jgi:transketolase